MPPLPDHKQEMFCQHVAAGKKQADAYAAAGYKPNRSHASRMAAKGNIKTRIKELQAVKRHKVLKAGGIETLSLMQKMIDLVEKAEKAGDYKTAIEGQKYILACFGYKDSPTLTHDHFAARPLPKDDGPVTNDEKELPDPAAAPEGEARENVVDFSKVVDEVKRQLRGMKSTEG